MSAHGPVYLSYTWPDRAHATRLRSELASRGIGCFPYVLDESPGGSGESDAWESDAWENIARADAVVVIVGATTYQDWFVDRVAAHASGKPVVVVKLEPGHVVPTSLYDVSATWTDPAHAVEAVLRALPTRATV